MDTQLTQPTSAPVKGFTLVELVVAIAIVAILTAIAWPTYSAQVTRGRRTSAKAAMMDIANREQLYLVANRVYADTTALQASGYTVSPDASKYYTWAVALGTGATPTFTITFTPFGPQTSEGALTLDQAGNRTPLGKWQQ